jgi:hypothetical protein
MTLHAFHRTTYGRVRGITTREQFRLGKLEPFIPVAQEYNRDEFLQQYTLKKQKRLPRESVSTEADADSALGPKPTHGDEK